MLRQSLRMTWRDWRAGELYFMLLALIVAVSALSSVGFFVDRLRTGLNRDANQLLGADLVIRADRPIDSSWLKQASTMDLQVAQTVTFPSMASSGTGATAMSQLASIKAVSPAYPLRGELKVSAGTGQDFAAKGIPEPGTVWVDRGLVTAQGLAIGDMLQLGDRRFKISQIITVEPDRGASFLSFAPRVLLGLSDLPSTGLIQNGSRVTYRLLIAGKPTAVAKYQNWAERQISDNNIQGMHMESLEGGRPEMQVTLERAEQFLSLVSLLSAMLAAVAIAVAARRFMLRHVDACAVMRCLGMTQDQLTRLFLIEFFIVGLVGSVLGALIGYGAHFLLLEWLGRLITSEMPPASWIPAWHAILTGLLVLIGFALPPVLQLRNVPHNRVIRREQEPPKPATLLTYGFGLTGFTALLLWQAGDIQLGLLTGAGFLGGFAIFALVGWLALKGLRVLRNSVPYVSWRFAITALQRRPAASILQIVALSLGLMALLLLTIVRGDLIAAWKKSTPEDAPNQFVINIQPEQKAEIESRLKAVGVAQPTLYPMIRGRLVQINDKQITGETFVEGRAKRLVDREFNLSTMRQLPPGNKVIAGTWLDDRAPEASVEEGLAKTLDLKIGDRLTFDVAGEQAEAKITSFRKLEWGSMRVNFFVILNPSLMADMPHTWITAFKLPADQNTFINELMRDFPNLTVVDVGSLVSQVQSVIDQVIIAVEFLFLFTLASGILVLYAALASSQDQRMREAGLLRALGATRKQLSFAQWIEFILTGGLAGLLAASGAAVVGWLLAERVFGFEWSFGSLVWIAGLFSGAACAMIGGWLGLRSVLRRPPIQTLREI